MPKSNAKRQSDWRNRHKDKLKDLRKVYNARYYQNLKNTLSEDELAERKLKDAERKRLERQKKLQKSEPSPNSSFKSPKVKGKMIKKIRNSLTGTDHQNKEVLNKLLEEHKDVEDFKRDNGRGISQEVIEAVEKFFNSDEISRASPNTHDFITIIDNGKKVQISVRHLMYSLRESYAMFLEDTGISISFSSFFQLCPVNVLSFTKIRHNVCVCQIHGNLRLVLKPLVKHHKAFENLSTDNKLHRNFVCSEPSDLCFQNECNECKDCGSFKKLLANVENTSEMISWCKWVKTNSESASLYCNIEKLKKQGTVAELLEEIYEQVPCFLNHQFVKMNQEKTFKETSESVLQNDSFEAVIVCDFAEKFKCTQQNELQSEHYGQTPVMIFTVAIYQRVLRSMVIVSDCEKNSKECVLAFVEKILQSLPETVTSVNFWSDNASSQFKNQYVMEGLKTFEKIHENIKITWNFFASMHGKSLVDGIGASVKRYVSRRINAQDILVKTAKDFALATEGVSIEVVYMPLEEISKLNKEIGLEKIVKNSKKIKEIKKQHFFKVESEKQGRNLKTKIVIAKISPKS